MFGVLSAVALGFIVGAYLASLLFCYDMPQLYEQLPESADKDSRIHGPKNARAQNYVSAIFRSLLQYQPQWLSWPDYHRTVMVNRIIKIMWPGLCKAILKEVLKQVIPMVKAELQKYSFVEEVTLGKVKVKDSDIDAYVEGKDFSLGEVPVRIGGIKVYTVLEDEGIIEIPLIYGSDIKIDIGAYLRFGPLRVHVPVELSNVQFKADIRAQLAPLVETLICIGGVTVSLLSIPHVDFSLKLFNNVDLLSFPVVKWAKNYALSYAAQEYILYPVSYSVPLMTDFGIKPPPIGMLTVTLERAEGLPGNDLLSIGKVKPYVIMEVREGRSMRSQVSKSSDPVFNETFDFVVDDFEKQSLKLLVYEEDMGNDRLVAVGEVPFSHEEVHTKEDGTTQSVAVQEGWMSRGAVEELSVQLQSPWKANQPRKALGKGIRGVGRSMGRKDPNAQAEKKRFGKAHHGVGTMHLKLKYASFSPPHYDDEDTDATTAATSAHARRSITTHVTKDMKGVLTVHLVRGYALGQGDSVDPFVRLTLLDPSSTREKEEVVTSRTVLNHQNPRWGDRFDFVNISALSTLKVEVFDFTSTMEAIFTLKMRKRFEHVPLGNLRIPVRDVVRNGHIKETFTLLDVENGQLEMALSWQTCSVSAQSRW